MKAVRGILPQKHQLDQQWKCRPPTCTPRKPLGGWLYRARPPHTVWGHLRSHPQQPLGEAFPGGAGPPVRAFCREYSVCCQESYPPTTIWWQSRGTTTAPSFTGAAPTSSSTLNRDSSRGRRSLLSLDRRTLMKCSAFEHAAKNGGRRRWGREREPYRLD